MMKHNGQIGVILSTTHSAYNQLELATRPAAQSLLYKSHQIHKRWITHFQGEITRETGKHIQALFYSAADAVACAKNILQEATIEGLQDLKIGIHAGEMNSMGNAPGGMVFDMAAHILAMVPPGQVLVSEAVVKMLMGPKEIRITFAGEEKIINVADPVKVFRVDQDSADNLESPMDSQVALEMDYASLRRGTILSKRTFVLVTALGLLSMLAIIIYWIM